MPLRASGALGALLQLVGEADLLRAVDTITDQWLLDRSYARKGGSGHHQPLVVNPTRADGQTKIAQARAEHDRSAGDEPEFGQEGELPGRQSTPAPRVKPEPLPQGLTQQAALLVDQV